MRRLMISAVVVTVLVACSGDGRDMKPPTEPLPVATTTTTESTVPISAGDPIPEPTQSAVTSVAEASGIEIERLFSPANATAEMVGVGAHESDVVTVDGAPGDVLSFGTSGDEAFVLQVWIEDEGAHTVCVADACGRVYTLAPDAESSEEVIAKIEMAIPLAQEYLDYQTLFPEWEVRIGGAFSGTGGTTDSETQTVTIYRNRGRSVDEYMRTILHEFGHVADFEYLTDDERAEYTDLRGIDASTAWRSEGAHRLDEWALQPSEDFAEVMVMIWTGGRWVPRTAELAPTPDQATLDLVLALL